jgi:hypothetical protein
VLDFCGTVMLYTRSICRTPACRSTTSAGARTSVRRSMGMTPATRSFLSQRDFLEADSFVPDGIAKRRGVQQPTIINRRQGAPAATISALDCA